MYYYFSIIYLLFKGDFHDIISSFLYQISLHDAKWPAYPYFLHAFYLVLWCTYLSICIIFFLSFNNSNLCTFSSSLFVVSTKFEAFAIAINLKVAPADYSFDIVNWTIHLFKKFSLDCWQDCSQHLTDEHSDLGLQDLKSLNIGFSELLQLSNTEWQSIVVDRLFGFISSSLLGLFSLLAWCPDSPLDWCHLVSWT